MDSHCGTLTLVVANNTNPNPNPNPVTETKTNRETELIEPATISVKSSPHCDARVVNSDNFQLNVVTARQ